MKGSVLIHVILDGNDHGMHRWCDVPRIGEALVVTVKGTTCGALVTKVVWGVSKVSRELSDECEVDLYCELIK